MQNNHFSSPIKTNKQALPWHEFKDWENFELLCNRLVSKMYNFNSSLFLQRGSKQEGVDIYYFNADTGKYRVWQCKCYKRKITKSIFEKWVQEFLDGEFFEGASEFSIFTTQTTETKDLKNIKTQYKVLLKSKGVNFEIYDTHQLDIKLKDFPEIVYDFYGAEWLKTFCGDEIAIQILEKKSQQPNKKLFSKPAFYIQREVDSYENYNTYYEFDKNKITLNSLILDAEKEHRAARLLLLSIAGIGKSSELGHLAYSFSNMENWQVCLINLSNYTGGSITELFNNQYENWVYWEKETLLLIDGLDEVKATDFLTACKEINLLSLTNPQVHIVVSSRTNFIKPSAPELDKFNLVYLNPLSYAERVAFIKAVLPNDNHDEFLSLLRNSGLEEHSNSPFYLHNAIEIYKENGGNSFPKTKAEVFEKILSYRIKQDLRKFTKSITDGYEFKVRKNLEKLAITMSMAGLTSIDYPDMSRILTDKEIQLCNHSLIVKQHSDSKWRFEHKSFQEYITATTLIQRSISEVLRIIAFAAPINFIKPKWVNVTSFLVDISGENENTGGKLIEWLIQNNKEVLIRFERDKIPQQVRLDLVKAIYIEHKKKRILIFAKDYRYDSLSDFVGHSKYFIQFLIDEISELSENKTLESALELFRYVYILPDEVKSKIQELLLDVLYDKNTTPYSKKAAINCIIAHNIYNETLIHKIVTLCPDINTKEVRSSIYSLILEADLQDKYVRYFIKDGFDIIIEYNNKVKSVGSEYSLYRLLIKCETLDSILFIFRHLTNNKDYFVKIIGDDFYDIDKSLLIPLIKNAERVFRLAPTKIFNLLYKYLLAYGDEFRFEKLKPELSLFFSNTGTSLKAFCKLWSDERNKIGKRDKAFYIGITIDESVAEKLTKDILSYKYTQLEIQDIFWGLSTANKHDLRKRMIETTRVVVGNLFAEQKSHEDYLEEKEEREKRNQELLLSKGEFLKSLYSVFDVLKKESLASEDLYAVRRDKEIEEEFDNSLAIDTLRGYAHKKSVTKESISHLFEPFKKWEGFVLNEVYKLVNSQTSLNPDLILFIQKWVDKNVHVVKFKESLVFKANGQITFQWLEEYFVKFVVELKLKVPESILMQMIWYDFSGVYNDLPSESGMKIHTHIISNIGNREVLKDYLIGNLKQGIFGKVPLLTHLKVCTILSDRRALKFVCTALADPNLDDWTKIKVYAFFKEMGSELEYIKEVYDSLVVFDYWAKHLTSEYMANGDYSIKHKLLSWFDNDKTNEDDKNEIALHLISCGEIIGLAHIFNEENNKNFLLQTHYSPQESFTLRNINGKLALPYFISILHIPFSPQYPDSSFSAVRTLKRQFIMEIGLSNDENYRLINQEIKSFIKKNERKLPNVRYLWHELDKLSTQYLQNKEDNFSFDEAISQVKRLLN